MLNDKLAAEAKRLAAEQNTSLSKIVNEALRERLARAPVSARGGNFTMPIFKGEKSKIDSTPAEIAAIGAEEEVGEFRP